MSGKTVANVFVIGVVSFTPLPGLEASCRATRIDGKDAYIRRYMDCSDRERTLEGSEIASALAKGKTIDISGAIIKGDIDLTVTTLRKRKLDSEALAEVLGELRIANTTFLGGLYSLADDPKRRISFRQSVALEHVTFIPGNGRRSISARFSEFSEGLSLRFSKFGGEVDFSDAVFHGPVSLFGATFTFESGDGIKYKSKGIFVRSEFFNATEFEGVMFWKVTFSGARFYAGNPVNFRRIIFEELSFESRPFQQMVMSGGVALNNVERGLRLKFDQASIAEDLDLTGATFLSEGALKVRESTIGGSARLEGVVLPASVEFYRSKIVGGIDLRNALVEWNKEVVLREVPATPIRISGADFLVAGSALWWYIPWRPPGTLRLKAGENTAIFLRSIERELRDQGDRNGANRLLYLRRRLEPGSGECLFVPVAVFGWLVCDVLFGWTVRPMNVAGTGAAGGLLFGLAFFLGGGVTDKTRPRRRGLWLKEPPIRSVPSWVAGEGVGAPALTRLGWALSFSAALMGKVNLGGAYGVSGRWWRRLAYAEWGIGYIWKGAMIYTFAKMSPFLDRWLSG
ncbi:MAG: hypothetical protein ACE5JQ_00865 [Candidatus Methylomirabilales bacterium]